MKNIIKFILQKLLGYKNYLYLFSKYKIRNLHKDKKEKDFFLFMSEIEEEGDILDIGANIGIMSYHLSKKFPSKKVYGIEPIPSNFEVLSKIKNKFKLN